MYVDPGFHSNRHSVNVHAFRPADPHQNPGHPARGQQHSNRGIFLSSSPMLGVPSGLGSPTVAKVRQIPQPEFHQASGLKLPKTSLVHVETPKDAGVWCSNMTAAAINVLTQKRSSRTRFLPPPSTSPHGAHRGSCHPHTVRIFPLSVANPT